MIVSIDWLREFVSINESPEELADILSAIGLEGEYLKPFVGEWRLLQVLVYHQQEIEIV